MAKKKKRRAGSGSRPGGRAGTSTQERGFEASSVKPARATPGGPNRLERKELARRQREAIRKRMVRRRVARRAGTWIAVAAVAAVVILLIAQSSGKAGQLNGEERRLLSQAPAAATAAGCSGVKTVPAYKPVNEDRAHIGSSGPATMPPLSSYPSQPPASGPHNSTPLAAGQYPDPPPIDQAIHSLEHGAVIVWYDPAALSTKALTDLQTFFLKKDESGKVIIAPYNYPNQGTSGKLPAGKQMAVVAWHRMETCSKVSLPVAFDFVYHYDSGFRVRDYKGEAPEPSAAIG